jgi:dolichyl-phosphate beta-glucosyltransferase
MYLSVIIPVYNEEKRFPKTIVNIVDFLAKQNYESEIIVVNDGSTDKTADLVKSFSLKYPIINLVSYPNNKGKGCAVKKGMLSAKGEKRLFMDVDGSTPVDQVEKLLPYFEQGHEVVIGSRRVKGSQISSDQSWYRLFLGWVFRNMVNIILPLGIIDSQNGFKMFSAKSANEIFGKQTIDGWAFDVQILYIAKRLGYKIKEVPISWTNDKESKVTLKGMMKMLWEVMKIRLGK